MVPWQIKETKGFKFKDTFIHKGVVTDPWSGVWNVAMTIAIGLCLGFRPRASPTCSAGRSKRLNTSAILI